MCRPLPGASERRIGHGDPRAPGRPERPERRRTRTDRRSGHALAEPTCGATPLAPTIYGYSDHLRQQRIEAVRASEVWNEEDVTSPGPSDEAVPLAIRPTVTGGIALPLLRLGR